MNASRPGCLIRKERSRRTFLYQLRYSRFTALAFYFLISTLYFSSTHAQLRRFVFSEPQMGSSFTIIFYDSNATAANGKAKQCFHLVDSLVAIYSDYIDSSELNRLCASAGSNTPFSVSPALMNILLCSKYARDKSNGIFDITLGPITRMWRKARKDNVFPSTESVTQLLSLTGFDKIKIDTVTHEVMLLQKGMLLDLGGIAQGYIAQKVIDLLLSRHIENALVDVSGDIVAIGSPPGARGWTVGVNVPERSDDLLKHRLLIHNKAVTTSGDVYQYMEHDGKRYSHVVDPRTGYGITSQKNVTIIAEDGTLADWLTKACSILPIEKAKQLAESLHAELLVAELKGSKLAFHTTKGFPRYWKPVAIK